MRRTNSSSAHTAASSTGYNRWTEVHLTFPSLSSAVRAHANPNRVTETEGRPTACCRARVTNAERQGRADRPQIASASTSLYRFPLHHFKYYFTLFSKFFSSFPHGTCSLSVSRPYLALDETYHPIRAAIPNNSTR